MKRNFLFLLAFAMVLMTACVQNDELLNEVNDSALAKVEMTYEQYLKGYTLEEVMAPKDEKTPTKTPETVADDELMKLIQDSLESTYSKTRVSTRAIVELLPYMGVFKVRTCGNYPELKVFMDNEDGGDWARVEGVNGLTLVDKNFPYTYVDGNRNIWLTFCLVMADQTDMIPQGYGALYLAGGNSSLITENAKRLIPEQQITDPDHSGYNPAITFLERFHDNEDDNNKNKAIYKGISTGPGYNPLGDVYPGFTPRPTYVGEINTMFTWMFPNREPLKTFHPGFGYGVLTNRDLPNVEIHIDDENGKNTNSISKVEWMSTGAGYYRTSLNRYGSYRGIDTSENTTYRVKFIM